MFTEVHICNTSETQKCIKYAEGFWAVACCAWLIISLVSSKANLWYQGLSKEKAFLKRIRYWVPITLLHFYTCCHLTDCFLCSQEASVVRKRDQTPKLSAKEAGSSSPRHWIERWCSSCHWHYSCSKIASCHNMKMAYIIT